MESTTTIEKKPQSTPAEKLTYLDVETLTRHVTDTGKILPRRITGLSAKQQRHVSQTIKRARNLLLMK
jgi:small subunit ribosomal protein S18